MTLQDKLAGLQGGAGTSGQSGDNVAGGGDAGKVDEAEKTKLRQQIAELQRDAQEAVPYVNAINALASTKVGKQIIEKLQKNEPLTDYQLSKLEKAAQEEGASGETPLTMEALEGKLAESEERTAKKVGETLRAQGDAARANDRLDEWAGKEFPGYEKIKGSKVWNGVMQGVINAIRDGAIEVKPGVDPWEVIVKRTYHTVVSEDPDILKGELPGAPKEEDRLSTILATGSKASASKGESEDDISSVRDGYYKRSLDFAKTRGSGAVAGLSYADRGASKKD